MSDIPIEVVTEENTPVWTGRGDGRAWLASYRTGKLWAHGRTAYRLIALQVTAADTLRVVVRRVAYTPEQETRA
jgi:hypothetical protein